MSSEAKRLPLTPKYLDPSDRLGEILFGVIMVLIFKLTAGFAADPGQEGVRELIFNNQSSELYSILRSILTR